MSKTGRKNFTFTQRLILEDYLLAKLNKKKIADKLGVSLSGVYKEIKRGEYEHKTISYYDCWGEAHYKQIKRYSANIAEEKYRLNMTSKGAPLKIGNDHAFAEYIENRVIHDKLSPCAVLGEIKRKKLFKTDISKTTLYRYISTGIFLHLTMKNLPVGARKKHYKKVVIKRPPKGTSIEKRPEEISQRNSFGHWEMDCVLGKKKSKDTLLVLTERLTRYEIILKMPNRKTLSVVQSLDKLEKRFGAVKFRKLFKSITVDNGVEFSDFNGLERSAIGENARTSLYYCHPYTSCERGSNERINRDIRRLIPKSTDLTKYSDKYIRFVEKWVNSYPREIFGFATAAEKFDEQLAAL